MKKYLFMLMYLLLLCSNVFSTPTKQASETISFFLNQSVDSTYGIERIPDSAHVLTYADNATTATFTTRSTTYPFSAIGIDTIKTYGDTTYVFADQIQDIDGGGGNFVLAIEIKLFTGGYSTSTRYEVQVVSDSLENFLDASKDSSSSAAVIAKASQDSAKYAGAVWVNGSLSNTNTSIPNGDGTEGNPVSTLVAARTIADNLGIKKYNIINSSSLTLAATHEDWIFNGLSHNSTLDLGSQDVDNSSFHGITMTGTMGGTGTIYLSECEIENLHDFDGKAVFSWLTDSLVMDNNSEAFLGNCYSAVVGNLTPTLDYNVASNDVVFRNYSGGIAIEGMSSNDGLSFDGNGQIIVNSTSSNAPITLRGNVTITDNGSGTVFTRDAALNGEYLKGEFIDSMDLAIPNVNVEEINGIASNADSLANMVDGGNDFIFSIQQLHIVNTAGSGIYSSSSAASSHGMFLEATGSGQGLHVANNGTGHGMLIDAGGTGDNHGVIITGKNAGDGIYSVGGATGAGADLQGGSTTGSGLKVSANSISGVGMTITGGSSGAGLTVLGGLDEDGVTITGGGTGNAMTLVAGPTGDGLNASATSGSGVLITTASGDAVNITSTGGNGDGLYSSGNGSGHGAYFSAGATGNGIYSEGGSTSGNGIYTRARTLGAGNGFRSEGYGGYGALFEGHGAFAGFNSTGGTTGQGMRLEGGTVSGEDLFLAGDGYISSSIDTVQNRSDSLINQGSGATPPTAIAIVDVMIDSLTDGQLDLAFNSVKIDNQTTNDTGLVIRGNGTAPALAVLGGASSKGAVFSGGASSGGAGAEFNGGGSNGSAGIYATSSATNGFGIWGQGAGSSVGLYGVGGSSGHGASFVGGGSGGVGLRLYGSVSHGLHTSGSGVSGTGSGIYSDAITSGAGIIGQGAGSGDGMSVTGGATGHGLDAQGGAGASTIGLRATTNGTGAASYGMRIYSLNSDGLYANSGNGNGSNFGGGTNGHGLYLSGVGTGAGLHLNASGTGGDLYLGGDGYIRSSTDTVQNRSDSLINQGGGGTAPTEAEMYNYFAAIQTGMWSATGSGGTGLYNVAIVTIDTVNTDTLPAVAVAIKTSTGADYAGPQASESDGYTADFSIDAGTYYTVANRIGYTFPNKPFTISGLDTIYVAGGPANTTTLGTGNLCTVNGYVTDIDGVVSENAVVTFELPNKTVNTCDEVIFGRFSRFTTTNASGYFELPLYFSSCVDNSTYTMTVQMRGGKSRTIRITVPDAATYEVSF